MAAGEDEPILVERIDRLLHLRLNRPAQRNAMSAALVDALIEAVRAFDRDGEAAVLLLSGAGTGFCAGSDLRGLAAMDRPARSAFEHASGEAARLLSASPKPVVACVHGYAIGGGLTLAVAADIVVTAANAKWSLPEVPIGLFPAWGLGTVERRAGVTAARRLAWGIDTLDGNQAAGLGLADICTEGDPIAMAMDVAKRLADLPAAQAAAVKAYFAGRGDDAAADARANAAFMASVGTAEAGATFTRFGGKA